MGLDDKKMCDDAIFVQDACNLIAVVNTFSRHLKTMQESGMGTDEICNHPVSVMFSSKIASLTNSESVSVFNGAFNYCNENK